jgi:hypothetical protein
MSGQFTFNDALTRAHVNPPAPFSGTGSLSNLIWSGSLAVDFSGHPNFALLGPSSGSSDLSHGTFTQP